jgi:hypothetical protein
MTAIISADIQRLQTSQVLIDTTAGRIFAQIRPQESQVPALVLMSIESPEKVQEGNASETFVVMKYHCWGSDSAESEALAELVRSVIDSTEFTFVDSGVSTTVHISEETTREDIGFNPDTRIYEVLVTGKGWAEVH